MNKIKRSKFFSISSILGISLIGIILTTTINLNSINEKNNLNNSLVNQNSVNLTKSTVEPKPLSSFNGQITSSSIDSGKINTDEVTDSDGNYFLTAKVNNNASIVKLNYQMQYLYHWTYNTSSNYETRQIVADTDDLGFYYALLVHNEVKINSTDPDAIANNIRFTIENPALVVQLYDTGSSFEQRNIYNLGLPNFAINNKSTLSSNVANNISITDTQAATNIWDHIYVEEAIQENDENSRLSFIRNTRNPNSTANNQDSDNIYLNDDSKSVIYKLLGKNGKKENNSIDSIDQDFYILKQLYLNNANNMVYLKDNASNTKMILIFGGNAYQSFWFYDFKINVSTKNTSYATPLLYANYDFDHTGKQHSNDFMYGKFFSQNRRSNVLKDAFYLPFMQRNKISNLAWFIGGAKTINLVSKNNNQSHSYVFLAMMQPNVSDFDASFVTKTNLTDPIKKGTYGTPDHVSVVKSPSTTSSSSTQNTVNNRNTNFQQTLQITDDKYQNKEVLVSSSSINASYQEFSSDGNSSYLNTYTSYKYPFSAIQSLTLLPVMTSEIAALIAFEPQSDASTFPSEKVYLNTFFESTDPYSINKFSLFNCIKQGNQFYKFRFNTNFFSLPTSWLKDKKSPEFTNGGVQVTSPVSQDSIGFSRILLNKNPENEANYVADGWKNAASQKIIAFSPQLTNNVFESSNGRFNQVVATLVLRGYVYSIAYDFELLQGVRLVPIANKSYNVNTNAIANSSSGLNNFRHLLSISYFDNTWAITYQNTKVETYVLKYSKDVNYSWSFSLESSLSTNTKLSKNITYLNNNFLFITQNKEIKVANTISKTQNFLNDDSSINSNAGIWGTIKPVDQKYLTDNNLLDKTPNEIASNQDLLKQLIDYSGGWSANSEGIPTVEPLIINIRTSRSTIEFDVAIKFINNKYYTSAPVDINVYPDIVQNSSLNIPSFKYDGFAVLAPWVMPAIIGGVVFLVLLFITIGVLVTLSLHKNKRMMQKGFASSNKKIDTLTTAVGSVYQKILTQTKNNKSPQMLKAAAKKPSAKNNVPHKSPSIVKPIPSSTPKKPI